VAVPTLAQVGSFTASPAAFSPDGDGINDFSTLRYSTTDTLLELSLIVFEADSITPVDTLIAPAPSTQLGLRSVTWDGMRFDGSPAPEAAYVATLAALSEQSVPSALTIPLFVDVTAPVMQVTSVSPPLYFPGVPGHESVLSVTFNLNSVSTVPPGRIPDEIQYQVVTPSGAPLDPSALDGRVSFQPTLPYDNPPGVDSDGAYTWKWDAADQGGLMDGIYRVAMFIVDAAGYTSIDTAYAEFDNKGPSISWISPPSAEKVSVLADSLYGSVWDRSGVDSLYYRYGDSGAFTPMQWSTRNDTAFFAVELAGAINTEGDHEIHVRAKDAVGFTTGHIARQIWNVTWLVSAPTPPTLDPFDGVYHSDRYTVSGDIPSDAEVDAMIRVYRNGARVDSIFVALNTRFSSTVSLVAGENIITATHVDGAGNESVQSNAVRVVLDESAGVFMPVPFRAGNDFSVNLTSPANSVELNIYDMTGDLVTTLAGTTPGIRFDIAWDVINGGGVLVKKGPLVLVVTINYENGSVEQVRKIFLVEPAQ
jgi:flagellar hook assembly protein FlgD